MNEAKEIPSREQSDVKEFEFRCDDLKQYGIVSGDCCEMCIEERKGRRDKISDHLTLSVPAHRGSVSVKIEMCCNHFRTALKMTKEEWTNFTKEKIG